MHKKCSRCELVNWANAVACRRCGNALSEVFEETNARIVGKEIAKEIKIYEDDNLEYQRAITLIRNGVAAGVICGAISFLALVTLKVLLSTPGDIFKLASFELGVTMILAIGVYLKSRVCAALLIAFYTIGKLALLVQGQIAFIGLFIGFLFLKGMYQGLQGTLQYHQIKERKLRRAHV